MNYTMNRRAIRDLTDKELRAAIQELRQGQKVTSQSSEKKRKLDR